LHFAIRRGGFARGCGRPLDDRTWTVFREPARASFLEQPMKAARASHRPPAPVPLLPQNTKFVYAI